MRAIHDQRVAIVLKLFMPAAPRNASIPGLNGDRMNLLPGDRGDVVRRDAGIDDALMVTVKVDVVDDRGLIVKSALLRLPRCDDAADAGRRNPSLPQT